jgi:membrane-associated phospholipid phosphatase
LFSIEFNISHNIHFFMRKLTGKIILVLGLFYLIYPSCLFASEADTLLYQAKKIQWYQTKAFKFGAVPIALIGLGISEINNNGIYSSYKVRDDLQKYFPGVNTRIDDVLPSIPVILGAGLHVAGVKGRNNFVNASIMFFGANMLGNYVGQSLKESTLIERPNGADFYAFPSNHTIAAFVAAEVLHQEYADKSPWISIAGYTMASTVGTIRMLENRHWFSDVLAGAGIGILSTRLTYVVYPWIHNKIFKKRQARGFYFAPRYIDGKPVAAFSYSF